MRKNYRSYILVLSILGIAVICRPSFGADWYVNPGAAPGGDGTSWSQAFQSIQQAVNAATPIWTICQGPPDTIHVRDGIYRRTTPIEINRYVNILGGYNFKGVRNWKNYPSIIDGQGVTRCLKITRPCILDGFTIRNGNADGDMGGGGIHIDSAPIYCSTDDFYHVPKIKNCSITDNSAAAPFSSGGGICDIESNTEIENCVFERNVATAGGAINHAYSSITIDKCLFHDNHAVLGGFCGGGAIHGFSRNDTTGGLIYITNSLFYENTSVSRGGAICNNQVDPQIWNCTFYNNAAGEGLLGGAYYGYTGSDGPYIYNSIFWENTPDQLYIDHPRYYIGHSDIQGGWTGSGGDNIDEDPLFVSPATGDFHLSFGSPCIDSGRFFGSALPDDLDGLLRPFDGNGDGTAQWDMGAYEFTRITLPGDLNWDWDLDGRDLGGFGISFGSHQGDSAYNAGCDFNADGAINENDLGVFADTFGELDL